MNNNDDKLKKQLETILEKGKSLLREGQIEKEIREKCREQLKGELKSCSDAILPFLFVSSLQTIEETKHLMEIIRFKLTAYREFHEVIREEINSRKIGINIREFEFDFEDNNNDTTNRD